MYYKRDIETNIVHVTKLNEKIENVIHTSLGTAFKGAACICRAAVPRKPCVGALGVC
jgi:hypothetical protein